MPSTVSSPDNHMRSTSGKHFIALDHLRALASFMVIAWHFLHYNNGKPVAFEGAPIVFPLALLDEGHTGVALFMVLSGYLFAKLLTGKRISYPAFFWNRFIRLAPMLILTFALVGIEEYFRGANLVDFFKSLYRGFVYPIWPNGGWSITAEIHFYLVLPLLLCLSRYCKSSPIAVVAVALVFRFFYHRFTGEVQSLSYWTIVGRIDQFVIGMLTFSYAAQLTNKRILLAFSLLAFSVFWWWFDATGGFYLRPKYPSPSHIWIFIPTFEGIAYASLVVWYDHTKINLSTVTSQIVQRMGEYSYSVYLLHVFFVFRAADHIHTNVMDISNFYVALAWSFVFFVAMQALGYLCFRFVERPFSKLRLHYVQNDR